MGSCVATSLFSMRSEGDFGSPGWKVRSKKESQLRATHPRPTE